MHNNSKNTLIEKCKVCSNDSGKFLFEAQNIHGRKVIDRNEIFKIYRCSICDAQFVADIQVNQNYYEKYYYSGYYRQNSVINSIILKILKIIEKLSVRRKEKLIQKYCEDKNVSILDVGCGTCVFLQSLNKRNYTKIGIEINEEGFNICKNKGIKVFNKPLADIDFGEKKFDVVTLIHVLEHIVNPNQLLREIYHVLKRDGLLLIVVPNNQSLGNKIGKKYWFHLDCPRHLLIPSIKTIAYLAKISNFKIVEVQNEYLDYPLDLFWSLKKTRARFFLYPVYPILKIISHESMTFVLTK